MFLWGLACFFSVAHIVNMRSFSNLADSSFLVTTLGLNHNIDFFARLLPLSVCILYFLSSVLSKIIKSVNFYVLLVLCVVALYVFVIANTALFGSWQHFFAYLHFLGLGFHLALIANTTAACAVCTLLRIHKQRGKS